MNECPYCKREYTEQVDKCPHCGYPINGTKEEQGVFVGRRIMMKGDIDESKDSIKRARIVLIILCSLYALVTIWFAILFKGPMLILSVLSLLITLLFLMCIFMLKKKPALSIWLSLCMYILLSLYSIINFRGIVLIGIVIGVLIKCLVDVEKAERAKKELR